MSCSSQNAFFEEHKIGSIEELVLLDDRFRDGSKHYYHQKTDRVYSQYFLRGINMWYFKQDYQYLVKKYKDPEGYREKEEARWKAIQDYLKARNQEIENCKAKYLSLTEIIKKHSSGNFILLTRTFLDDLIANRHFMAWPLIDGKELFSATATECELAGVTIDQINYHSSSEGETIQRTGEEKEDCKTAHGPAYERSLTENCGTRRHGIFYDIQTDGKIFIELNGWKTKVESNHIYITCNAAFTYIRFLRQSEENSENEWEPANGMKFKSLDLEDRLSKYQFISYIDENQRFICEGGMIFINEEKKWKKIMPNK